MRKEFRSLISLEEALSTVLRSLPSTSVENVPLPDARGHILAEKVVSSQDVPGFYALPWMVLPFWPKTPWLPERTDPLAFGWMAAFPLAFLLNFR